MKIDKKIKALLSKWKDSEINWHDIPKEREELNNSVNNICEFLKDCIDRGDSKSIFEFEYGKTLRDDNVYGESNYRLNLRPALKIMKLTFEDAHDKEKLIKSLIDENKGELPQSVPNNAPFFDAIRTFKSQIAAEMRQTRNEEDRELLRTRHDTFEFLKVSYENCIRKEIGLTPLSFKPRHHKKENELER